MKINRTTERAIHILELIAASENDLTLNDIAKFLQIPKTSAFDILTTLVETNMIYVKDPRLKTYAIGVKAYAIGNMYSKTSLLVNASAPIIKDLANTTGLTILIAKETNGKIIFIAKQEPPKKIIATPNLGDEGVLHTTSIGKTILAFSHKQEKLLEQMNLQARTKMSITSKGALFRESCKV